MRVSSHMGACTFYDVKIYGLANNSLILAEPVRLHFSNCSQTEPLIRLSFSRPNDSFRQQIGHPHSAYAYLIAYSEWFLWSASATS